MLLLKFIKNPNIVSAQTTFNFPFYVTEKMVNQYFNITNSQSLSVSGGQAHPSV